VFDYETQFGIYMVKIEFDKKLFMFRCFYFKSNFYTQVCGNFLPITKATL